MKLSRIIWLISLVGAVMAMTGVLILAEPPEGGKMTEHTFPSQDIRRPAVAGSWYPGTAAELSKEIDDLLYSYGIEHKREPSYPDSNFRADWLLWVGNEKIFVEFFGLYGESRYTKRMKEKLEYAKSVGIRVIAFLPKDLSDLRHAFSIKVLSLNPNKNPQ